MDIRGEESTVTQKTELFEPTHLAIVRATVTTMISAPPDATAQTIISSIQNAPPDEVRLIQGYLALSLQWGDLDVEAIEAHVGSHPPLKPGVVDETTERLVHALWQQT